MSQRASGRLHTGNLVAVGMSAQQAVMSAKPIKFRCGKVAEFRQHGIEG
jgi:hypothetical protein